MTQVPVALRLSPGNTAHQRRVKTAKTETSRNTSMKLDRECFRNEKISRILLHMAPPVMLAQLIQALYNIIDSFFIGQYSLDGLTALSVIYPIQLLMIAIAVGTGVGINAVVAYYNGLRNYEKADAAAGTGAPLAFVLWVLFSIITWFVLPYYASLQTSSEEVIREVVLYGKIVTVLAPGLFFESMWTKVCQANGDMKTPMYGQILGAIVNIALDPILIFGWFGLPEMGIAGAGIATVIGQAAAAAVVFKKGYRPSPSFSLYPRLLRSIYRAGVPNILMQTAYTVYILGLNIILAGFSDAAVTALGLYYKWQTIFFIPLGALQTCIVPIVSFNFAYGSRTRCYETMKVSTIFGLALMAIGTLCFELIPREMLSLFTDDSSVLDIGTRAFRCIGWSFLPMVLSLTYPVYFEAIDRVLASSMLTILRTVVLFVPLGYLFSRYSLEAFWFTFLVTEIITASAGAVMYYREKRQAAKAG